MEKFKTTCSYCGVGCGIEIIRRNDGKLFLTGDAEHPVNEGKLCSKGMNLHYTVMDTSERILYPEVRWNAGYPRERSTWTEAISRVASVFKSMIQKHGPDSVGLYVSGQLLTEEYYLANKLTKGFLGTANIDTNSRLCMSSAVVGYKKSLGADAVPISYSDIDHADCILIIGANPAWCHPILFRRIEEQKSQGRDIKIITIDPRRTDSAVGSDLFLQIRPGTDIYLLHAIARCLIEYNYTDDDFIRKHTNGFDALKTKVFGTEIAEAAKICGVEEAQIRQAAQWIGQSKGFLSLWAMGLNQSSRGVNKNLALLNLSLLTGQIGKPGSGPFSLTGQPNAMGGREVGGLSNMLAAHRDLTNPEHRKDVAEFWGVDSVPDKPGLTATQMLEALGSGKLKALWVICTNPAVSLPDANMVEKAFKSGAFIVVQDISSRSDTLEYAHVVLPAAGWLEKEGTMTNSERRITYLPQVVEPPGEALPDSEILIRFAKEMGFGSAFDYDNTEDIFLEHARLTAGTNLDISGLTYDILKKEGSIQWPYRAGKGTERLFTDHKFFTSDGKANLFAVDSDIASEPLTESENKVLITGRVRDQWHTRTRTGKVNKLRTHFPEAFAEIHPTDAAEAGIQDGETVNVRNSRGSVKVKAIVTDSILPGTVFLPMHWGKSGGMSLSRANNLTSPILDPISKEPDFKFAAAGIRSVSRKANRVVVLGGGTAAYHFILEYRKHKPQDSITVVSGEKSPFYNRIFLPDVIEGRKSDSDLQYFHEEALAALGIQLFSGALATGLDIDKKRVLTSTGKKIHFDKLVIATGSRANRPRNLDISPEGVFTLRTIEDAALIRKAMQTKEHVFVSGGGLLGLEVAASLVALGKKVTVLQRSEKLMSKQLDSTASRLLTEELRDMGIQFIFNDEIRRIVADKGVTAVRLASGRFASTDCVIFAIGTKPNMEFAREAVETHRGIVVDGYLRTSHPDIIAIGEVAEFQGQIFGIAKAAEEQAKIAALHLSGSQPQPYTGSVSLNILKIPGVHLAVIGDTRSLSGRDEVILEDKDLRYYKKCLIENDRMVGAILLGDTTDMAEFIRLIETGSELGEKRKTLLRSSTGASKEPPLGKIVCSCLEVGEGNLEQLIEEGITDLNQLCEVSGAGTGCGSCKPEVARLLEQKESSMKEPALV